MFLTLKKSFSAAKVTTPLKINAGIISYRYSLYPSSFHKTIVIVPVIIPAKTLFQLIFLKYKVIRTAGPKAPPNPAQA